MEIIDPRILGLAIAIGLGLLVGMQREWVADKPIGLRSFALISTIGGLIGLFAMEYGAWILASGLIAITIAIYSHAYFLSRQVSVTGMTTELAAIAMFLVGALATSGYMAVAVVLGGVITLLLHWKVPMHTLVERIGEIEFQAIARFVLISLVVLPILPNNTYGPYSVLNPWQIWLMVVLIVSINLAAYVSMKVSSGKGGALLSGVLGGLISSTATTVAFSTRSRGDRSVVPIAGVVIIVASALVYLRVVIETAVVARGLLPELLGPVVAFLTLFAFVIGLQLIRLPQTAEEAHETSNPAELKTALSFALLYSVVLFISAAVSEKFGESMLYPVAGISGLTDVDAITLSIGRLFVESRIDSDIAWRVIFVASLSNLAFKAGVVAVIGGTHLRRRVLPALLGLTLVGFVGVWLWP
jgi:uncharacterized membrane protein (DUF4010 family)